MAADGVDVAGTGLRPLRHPLHRPAPARGRVVRPLRRAGAPALARARWPRSRPRRPARSSRRSARCTASCTRPASARVDGRGMAAALRQAAAARGVDLRDGRGARRRRGRRPADARHVEAVEVEGHRNVACDAAGRRRWRLDRGGRASGSARGCRSGPTKGQIVHLGVEAETGDWPIVQPLLTHYLVPWPGGRVACGGTFEAGAGFSVTVTAAGLHELLRECLSSRPDWRGRLPRDAGRAAAHLGRRSRRGRAGCRAGATPGWPPATAPTACCRGRSRRGCWPTPWRASRSRRTRRRCRRRSTRRVSPEGGAADQPPRSDGLGVDGSPTGRSAVWAS